MKERETLLTLQEHDDDGDEYFYYYNSLHVSSNTVLLIRRSNWFNTTSRIVLSVSERPLCRIIIIKNELYNVIVNQVGPLPRAVPECTVSKT